MLISHKGFYVIENGFVLFATELNFCSVYLSFRPTELIFITTLNIVSSFVIKFTPST